MKRSVLCLALLVGCKSSSGGAAGDAKGSPGLDAADVAGIERDAGGDEGARETWAGGDGPPDADFQAETGGEVVAEVGGDDAKDREPERQWDTALEPIHVTGTGRDGQPLSDLRVVGSGLVAYEGHVVTFRIGDPGSFPFGSGQVRVTDGKFDVLFPNVDEPSYKYKLVHFDADGSGACEVGEPVLFDTNLYALDTTITITPATFLQKATSAMCARIAAPPP